MNSIIKKPVSGIHKVLTSFSFRRDWIYLFFVVLAVAAALLLKYAMAWGPWAFSDSAAYISAARNLVAGHGLTVSNPQGGFDPLTLHQPLYPLIMSFFLLFDIHPFTTSLVISMASFSLSLLVFSAGIYYFSRSRMLAICCSLLFLASPNLIGMYDGAMSEPLYLFLTIVSFFAVLYYIRNQNAFMLYLAATLTGLSILTRYIGLSNALCGAVLIFIFLPENSKTSLQWSLLFTGFSILPPAVWLLLGSFEPKQSVRSWQIPTDMFKQFQLFIRQLFETFSDWLPFKKEYQLSTEAIFPLVIILFSAVVILFLAALLIKRNSGNQIENGAAILVFSAGQFILVYLTVFYVAIAISSLPPDVNTRTMVPLLPFLILLLPGLLYFYTIRSRWTILMPLILILSCGWVLSSTRIAAYDLVTNRHLNGHGFTASYWQGSTVLKAARDLSQEIPWISNQPALFLLYLNKFPYDLTTVYPEIIRDGTLPFGQGGSILDRIFREEGAALLLHQPQFENDLRKLIGDSAEERVETFSANLKIYQKSYDGTVYFYNR